MKSHELAILAVTTQEHVFLKRNSNYRKGRELKSFVFSSCQAAFLRDFDISLDGKKGDERLEFITRVLGDVPPVDRCKKLEF